MKKMKIDWKQLFLEKGERIGLGVALFFSVIVTLIGLYKIFASDSPTTNAQTLKELADKVSSRQAASQPDASDLPPKAADAKDYVAIASIDPNTYRTETLFDSPRPTDTKRRNPSILPPDEFRVQAVLAQLRSYDLIIDRNTGKPTKVTIVEGGMGDGGLAGPKIGDNKDYKNKLGSTKGYGSSSGPSRPPMGGPMGGGPMGGQPYPGGDGRFGYNGPGGNTDKPKTVQAIDVDKLDKFPSAVFAEKVWAKPMIVIAGTFPYKEQVLEFQRQLRMRHPGEVLYGVNQYAVTQGKPQQQQSAPPLFKFEGIVVERLTLGLDGNPIRLANNKPSDWVEIPHERFFKEVAMVTGKRFETEDTELPPLLYQVSDELLMGLPIQFHENRYPKLFNDLDNLKKTVAEIKKNDAKNYLSHKKGAFEDDDFKPYGGNANPTSGPGMTGPVGPGAPGTSSPGPMGPGGPTGPYDPSGMGQQGEVMIPDHCMFRIVDTDPRLEPGKTYKYRIRIRMANPNYTADETVRKGRKDTYPQDAEKQYLVSPAVEIPQTATLPAELHFYAVDQKELEGPNKYRENKGRNAFETPQKNKQVMLQVHRWLDVYFPDLKNPRSGRTVGDWSVAERMAVYRGELVRRDIRVEVPEKPLDQADFILASDPKLKATQDKHLIAVTFGDESVLVDFEDVDRVYRRLESPAMENQPARYKQIADKASTEVLIFTPDGRLIAKNSADDKEDPERIKRLDTWRQHIEKLRGNTKPGGGGAFGQP